MRSAAAGILRGAGWHCPRTLPDWTVRRTEAHDAIFPGDKQACDGFLAGKPERVTPLPAGHECHGYFMKRAD